jgi:O-antigen ligase
VAFKRWIRGIGGLMMVLIILTESDSKEAIKATFLRCAYVLVPLSVLTIKYYRHIGVQYNRWTGDPFLTGITTDKNALGRLCLISSLFFLWNFFELKTQKRLFVDKKDLIINTIMMMSIAWLLMKSNSATSIGALVIGIFVIAGLGLPFIRQNPERLSWFIFLLFVTIVIFEYSFNLTEIVVVRGLGRNMTFTYRTFIWRDLISLDSAPLIGVGFGSFWLGDRLRSLAEIGWKTLGEAHNGYLEIYLSLGIIGLGILTAAIVSCYRNIRRKLIYDFENARFQLALLFIILIYNITESAFRESSLIFFVFLLLSLDRDRQEQYRI